MKKNSPPSQILFKENWKPTRSGGKLLEWELDRSGEDLLVPAKLEEITPGRLLYMRGVWKPREFYPTRFHHSMSWFSVKELFKTGRIWRLTQETKDTLTSYGYETSFADSDGQEP